jgi:hypothetical protein
MMTDSLDLAIDHQAARVARNLLRVVDALGGAVRLEDDELVVSGKYVNVRLQRRLLERLSRPEPKPTAGR